MSINIWRANMSASQLRRCASDVQAAIGRMSGFQGSLHGAWRGPEVGYIDTSVEQTKAELRRAT